MLDRKRKDSPKVKKNITAFVLIVALLVPIFGQQPSPTPTLRPHVSTPAQDDEEVVRITTNLVQVDAVVTDRDGNQVTDLRPEDFEVLENDQPQRLTNFSYITTQPATAPLAGRDGRGTSSMSGRSAGAPTLPPVPLQPGQVKRALALVADDLRMSAEGVAATRKALRKYVDEQVQEGDLVAIIRTSAGIGALQQFTNDRQQLYAAIERVRPLARAGLRLGAFTSLDTLERLETQSAMPELGSAGQTLDSQEAQSSGGGSGSSELQPSAGDLARNRSEGLNEFRDTLFTVGTMGALNFVVRGLKELPGRKAVVLFSDGISFFSSKNAPDRNERVLQALRQLVDQASRASVVIYTIDTRGLQPTGLTAADNTSGSPAAPSGAGPGGSLSGISGLQPHMVGNQVLGARSSELIDGQAGLNFLARETGGVALINQNDLNKGIRRALDDLRGYYLLGYKPADSTFDPKTGRRRYITLTVKVKNRSGLKVRSRSGFLSFAEEQPGHEKKTRAEQLMTALLSPFSSGGVNLRLTSFFLNEATTGSMMRSVLLMDARNLTFAAQPDGQQQTVMEVVAVTLGEDGQVVDQVSRVETIRARPDVLQRFQSEGMVYSLNVPISKPGAYQLRIAVRDAVSGRIGSASQYIEVPNVKKDRLTLSSLVISGNHTTTRRKTTANDLIRSVLKSGARPANAQTVSVVAGGEGMMGTEDPLASPASRRFRQGMFLDYACVIHNARLDKTKQPRLTTQVRLFREGQEVFTGEVTPLDFEGQTDLTRLVVARRLQLGSVLTPGEYVLLLTVMNEAASGKDGTATRWIDFRLDH